MKKVNIFILAILLLTAGCGGNKQSGNDDLITVDVTKSYPQKELILQDFMDVEYIPLETINEFVCQGRILAIGKDIILVKNNVNDGDIFVFDRNGKGLRKINRTGRGGEEYLNISGIVLDEDNGEMFVNDGIAGITTVYDLFGKYKRSFRHKDESKCRIVYNFDRESLICRESFFEFERGKPPFVIISKQDGSIVKEIRIPFEQIKSTTLIQFDGNSVNVWSIGFSSIIPYHDSWIITEPSSDTIFRFLPDYNMIPFVVRIPSVQSMEPEVFLFPKILTDRYYFMESVKKENVFVTNRPFPKTNVMYERQENMIYEYTVYNDDYSNKKTVDMDQGAVNFEIAFWQKLEADELVEDYEKGVLKGKLKEIAAKLKEEDNPVIMLVKHKK